MASRSITFPSRVEGVMAILNVQGAGYVVSGMLALLLLGRATVPESAARVDPDARTSLPCDPNVRTTL